MIEVGLKKPTRRKALAEGKIFLPRKVITMIRKNQIPKGDVLKAAEIAGLLALKNTFLVIPHCHPVKITSGALAFSLNQDSVTVRCEVTGFDRTGFEMEALHAVMIALLTIYDMCKFSKEKMKMGEIVLVRKTGGTSNH